MLIVKKICEFDNNTIIIKNVLNCLKIYFQIIQIKKFIKNIINLQCVFFKNVKH